MLALMLTLTLLGAGLPSFAQRQNRANERQVEQALSRIDARTEAFRRSLDLALDRGRLNSTTRVVEINDHVRDFDAATDTLRDRFNNRRDVAADVEALLRHAAAIDSFTQQNLRNTQAARDWDYLRTDLEALARLYNVRTDWSTSDYQSRYPTDNRYPNDNRYPSDNRYGNGNSCLTGTYQLDPQRSDDATRAAERATQSLDYNNRDRVRDNLVRRLEAPETLSIDRRGRSVTVASDRAPQVTFEADGRARNEQNAQGRNIGVTASLMRDQLTVTTSGDRGSDFTLTFEPIEGCRSLRVTRRLMNDRLNQPVIVQSTYARTADTAQLDLYDGRAVSTNRDFPATSERARGSFVVPDGTQIVAILDTDLTTKASREGDRFTMTVRSPASYDGAVIEGYVRSIERSGRISGRAGVALDFDRIRLRNGQSYNFAGTIESVRTADGNDVRVDSESNVEEDSSQTSRTATRAGVGAALGALIGAIAGGGKGAAIGAVVGAGTGAGTVIVQGRDDLDLKRGTELSVRASAPR